jgi:formylglycine-generating enzyme required for sulfatase activity
MGSPASDADRISGEDQVNVTLSRGFWLFQTEVTQGLWQSVMGTTPWSWKDYVHSGENYPAVNVSHGLGSDGAVEPDSATEFCRNLTARERAAGRLPSGWSYQLPTEAQWEYACRAGTTGPYNGDGTGVLSDYAWYSVNANVIGEYYAHLVGQKKPNRWGLLDMHGNVWEWCQDWYGEKLPGGRNPLVSAVGSYRVLRGGSWFTYAGYCRSASRYWVHPSSRNHFMGFRVALSPSGD